MHIRQFLRGGSWHSSARTRVVTNPYTGRAVHEVYQASQGDLVAAIDAAGGALLAMRELSTGERSEILSKVSATIRSRKEEFARLITAETGKPITFSRMEVDRSIFTFATAAAEARRITGELLPLDQTESRDGRFGISRRFPLGVISAITPFNFPLNLVAHKLGPAFAAGNTVVLKPSSNAPVTALLLGEVFLSAGIPAGALNIVPCASDEASQLIEDQRVKLVSFTGSPVVGWSLKSRAPKKRVVLELGGNAGVIVDKSADRDLAVRRILLGGFSNAGQSCISVQRVYVHADVYSEFMDQFLPKVLALPVGDPEEEQTVVGPMIDEAAARKVEKWVASAVEAGARLLCGGTRSGAILAPTVLENVNPKLEVSCQEVFAPLLTVESFKKFPEAVARVNASEFGLQAGVFTNDYANIFLAYRELEVGGVIVNDASSYRMDIMPYGGVKDSGMGREGIRYAIEEMTEMKFLVLADR